jgi:hypothetical protein
LVVQRQRLEEVVKEQALQLSGRVADESTVRVGRLAGATVLVTGSVAETVVRVLTEMNNVSPQKVSAVSYGEFKPLADNLTPETRAKNRRVEMNVFTW